MQPARSITGLFGNESSQVMNSSLSPSRKRELALGRERFLPHGTKGNGDIVSIHSISAGQLHHACMASSSQSCHRRCSSQKSILARSCLKYRTPDKVSVEAKSVPTFFFPALTRSSCDFDTLSSQPFFLIFLETLSSTGQPTDKELVNKSAPRWGSKICFACPGSRCRKCCCFALPSQTAFLGQKSL